MSRLCPRCRGKGRVEDRRTKLSPEDVAEIRRLRADGHKISDVAARFGVGKGNISKIANGLTWRESA